MKLLLLLAILISCEEPSSSHTEYDETEYPRISLASTYTMNGDDYHVITEQDYASYTTVFSLVRYDGNDLVEHKETFRLKRALRSGVAIDSSNAISRYLDGNLRGGSTKDAYLNATNDEIEVCRKEEVNFQYEYICETFFNGDL